VRYLICLALLATACKTKIDPDKAEKSLRDLVEKQGVVLKSVDCPKGLTAKTGEKFKCTAVDDAGATITFDIEMTDDKGSVNIKLATTIVVVAEVQEAVRKKIEDPKATLKCKGKAIVITQEKPAQCEVVLGDGSARPIKFTENKPGSGDYHWEIPPLQ
jgi:hypothetical protein